MLTRSLTLASLIAYLVSLAAAQTAYGKSFMTARWIALIALFAFGMLAWFSTHNRVSMESINVRVLAYLSLWGFTAINGAFPLFSGYRLFAHAMIVVSSLIFLPQIVRLEYASKLLLVLKILIAITLIISLVKPSPLTVMDVANEYRGIFGNANSLGHTAAIGCLLFLHGFLTRSSTFFGRIQLMLMGLAGVLLIRSGARSSFVALLSGLFVLFLLYRREHAKKVLIGWIVVFTASLALATQQTRIEDFVFKRASVMNGNVVSRLTESRTENWDKSLSAFKERPLLGWGFGVDSDTDLSKWHGQWSSIGYTARDPVNDVTYTLETGGIVGLLAYLLILSVILKLRVPPDLMTILKAGLNPREYALATSAMEARELFMSLNILLIVMFEFDDTALSAGNFLAALMWISLGMSILFRSLLVHDLPLRLAARYFSHQEPMLVSK